MGKRLTAKESAFCEAIAAGDTVAVAYKNAYDTEQTGQRLYSSGQRVYNKPHIKERIEILERGKVESAVNNVQIAREEQTAFIRERIEICKEKGDEQSIIRYTDMLNRIYGTYKADSSDPQQDNTLNSVSVDVLQKIAESI